MELPHLSSFIDGFVDARSVIIQPEETERHTESIKKHQRKKKVFAI